MPLARKSGKHILYRLRRYNHRGDAIKRSRELRKQGYRARTYKEYPNVWVVYVDSRYFK